MVVLEKNKKWIIHSMELIFHFITWLATISMCRRRSIDLTLLYLSISVAAGEARYDFLQRGSIQLTHGQIWSGAGDYST